MKSYKTFLAAALAALCAGAYYWPSAKPAATPSRVEIAETEPARPAVLPEDAGTLSMTPELAAAEPRKPNFAKIVAFNDWAQRWQAADAGGRNAMREDGLRLATERRPEFKSLIVVDPQRALERAVPRVIRQDLPLEIVAQLERPVSASGDLNVYRGRPQGAVIPGQELTLRYFETERGESLKARVSGEMSEFGTKKNVALRGVALDREFAVAESPVRQLEKGERIPATAKVEALCPVSGLATPEPAPNEPVSDETPTVEIGERIVRLCNGTHVGVLIAEQRALLQASGPGGAGFMYDTFPGTSSAAIGNFKTLYIRVTYPDQLKAPNTEDAAYGDMRNVSRFYLESSYGRMTTTSTVTPLIVLPHSQAWYIAKDSEVDGLGLVHTHSRAAAKKLGYHDSQYTCIIVRVNGGPRLSGISWGGGSSVWVSWDGMDVLNHECGHSLGRNHANYWATTDGTPYGEGANSEYGNPFDVMGGGGGFGAHYNAKSKRDLGWLSDPYMHRPTAAQNGNYRIFAYDQPQLEEGKRYSFRVAKDSVRTYYIEYHPANANFTDSALVMYSWSGMSNCGHLLDTTPGTPSGKNDGGIQIGRTYSDYDSDQHFTVLGKNATTPPSLDIAYQRGPFPTNQAPTLTLAATTTTPAVGGSVTFTATADDTDGDVLAYNWNFSDGVVSTNTPTFTRTFASATQMTVMCAVSDMKGGIARKHVVVTVGSPGRGVVTGTITNGGQPLVGVLVTSDTSKYCYTDSAGAYALSNLTTGARTLTAVTPGYTLTASFTNPITVTTGTNTGDWTAATKQLVTLTKTNDATEGGATGSFTITRTGDTTAALDVRVSPVAGTATLTTDYTFTPAIVDDGSFRKFTIPAGEASLAITVAAVNDTAAEGPESISIQLVANGAGLTNGPGLAVMTVEDNDTALPVVSVAASDLYANETPGDTGTFVVSRTGATGGALNVVVAYSGAAANTTDYVTLSTTVTIPGGQSSANVTLTPVNDTLIEGPEDATITISTNAAYIRDAALQTATINITDDDTPVVSVTAIDASADEAGRDPGVVLISRTGSTAAALTVYYGVSGRALHGTDYGALTGQVIIPAGSANVPVVITPYDDYLGEPDPESVTFSLTTFGNAYSLSTSYTTTVNIADNDDVPVVSIRTGTTPTEPGTAGTFIIRAIGSATGNITVPYTLSGTATAGSDYTAPSGSVSISANGTNDVTVTIPTLDDATAEDTETIIGTLTPGAGYRVYNDGSATLRLKDNDSGERVMVSAWNGTPAEAASAVGKFYFSREGTAGDLVVSYAISGTAINGTDYTLLPGAITIPDTASGADLIITPTDDALLEGSENVTVTVVAGAGYGAEIPASATLWITDNETLTPSVGFASATGATTEALVSGSEFRDISVTLTSGGTDTVTVNYTGSGGTAQGDDVDWAFVDAENGNAVIPGGTLTFAPGVTSQNVRIRVKNDTVIEGDETALLVLQNARFARISSSRGTHTLTISDANNPTPRVRMLLASSTRAEPDGTEPLLMAVLDRALTTSATVQYTVTGTATSGSDYTLAPGTLTFAAGETMRLLPLAILSDATIEPIETIVVTLTNPTVAELGTPSAHTITLRDAITPEVSISATTAEVDENAGPAQFTVTLAASLGYPLTVHYTVGGSASAGGDYTAPSGMVVIPIGASSVPLPISLVDDTTLETDETLIITLSADASYDLGTIATATTTINDDDTPPVVTIVSPARSEITIPTTVGLMVNAEATRDTPQGITNVPVTWSTVSGPGTVTFESVTSTASAASFSTPGTYVLRASSTYGATTVFDDVRVNMGLALTAQTIGTSTAAGSWSEADSAPGSFAGGTITLTGASTGISSSGTTDGFYFLAAPRTGDFDIAVRVVGFTNPGASTSHRMGIMCRASTATNSVYAMTFYKGDRSHGFQARLTAGTDPYDSNDTTARTLPDWIRLRRVGDTFAAYYGTNGTTWTQRGATQTIATMGASPLVGFVLTSAATATASTATFDSANFSLPTNIGPNVDAGPALSGSGPWALDATATDDGRPAPLTPLWVNAGGAGIANFTAPSAIDTGVTFSATGAYRLRLTVGDGAITTFDETTANVTVSGPLLTWRQSYFGTTDTTGDAANMADMDGDGVVNLIEYAMLTSPIAPGGSPIAAAINPGNIVLTVSHDTTHADVIITIEAATSLAGTWTPIARSTGGAAFTALVGEASVSESGTGPVAATITISTAGAPGGQFFRVKVNTSTP